MRRIIWIGEGHFADSLSQCGWEEVRVIGEPANGNFSWSDIAVAAGFTPDVVVAADLAPAVLREVENFPALTVYFSSISHLKPWQADYAQAFDACLVVQGDDADRFAGSFLPAERVWWSPPFAGNEWQPQVGPAQSDGIFMHPEAEGAAPEKSAFWNKLERLAPLRLCRDNPTPELYANARVVVSQPGVDELGANIFEVMGSGACLVTPRLGRGLEKLFVDGEHYVGYAPGDAGDAAYRVNFLLDNPDLYQYIGQTAAREIDARHRAIHRAYAFTDHLCDLAMCDIETLIAARRGHAAEIQEILLNLPLF